MLIRLESKNPSLTPFAYTANNPINLVDFDGKALGVAIGVGIVLGVCELTVLALGSVVALAATSRYGGNSRSIKGYLHLSMKTLTNQ